jgi:predicted enzyme related to lactoylglutathione lyase
MTISLTSVYVNDPIRAFEFYTQVLGFVERVFMPHAFLAIVASPEQPDGTGLLLEPNQNPIASRYQKEIYDAGLPIIVFGTRDIHAEHEKLVERGVVFRKPPTKTDWGIEAVFEDTFGNLVQIAQA